jgi:hypothetical protein
VDRFTRKPFDLALSAEIKKINASAKKIEKREIEKTNILSYTDQPRRCYHQAISPALATITGCLRLMGQNWI